MKLRVESGLTGQIGKAKGNTPRGTIRIDINTHQIVLEITQREDRITHLKVDHPVNIESTIDMMTTTITVQTIVAGRDHGHVKDSGRTVTQIRSTLTNTTVTLTRGDMITITGPLTTQNIGHNGLTVLYIHIHNE